MAAPSFVEHVGSLDDTDLAALLAVRPEARAEPVPRSLERLADRLGSPASVAAVLGRLDLDVHEVARAVAVLGDHATQGNVADLLDAPPELVRRAGEKLTGHGLGWVADDRLHLVPSLRDRAHLELGADGRIDRLARHVRAEDLRGLASAHGVDVAGLRKNEVVDALVAAFGDIHAVAARVAALPDEGLARLSLALSAATGGFVTVGAHGPRDRVARALVEAGMLVETDRGTLAVPAEVSVATWLVGAELTGPPTLAPAPPPDPARASGAALTLLRTVAALLDRAAGGPIPALKSGAVGKRERARLVKALDLDGDADACLALDLASAAGLLARGADGFTTTEAGVAWRDDPPARRWTVLARAWWDLGLPPTWRTEPDGSELAPPVETAAPAHGLRRAVLRVAAPDRSLLAASEVLDWFLPLDPEPPDRRDAITAATRDEALRLGLADGDALAPLGIALLADRAPDAAPGALDAVAAEHLAVEPARLLLQSDLTAVLSGHAPAPVVRLLDDAADVETRGAATTYRFSASSVRRALDAGWTAETVLDGLRAVAVDVLPQPLEYLVADAARRHGTIRAHTAQTCVVAEEPVVDELVAARALAKLAWRRLAPTVLSSGAEPSAVLATLRSAGYSPVLDDGAGAMVLERAAPAPLPAPTVEPRALPTPQEVVARVRAAAEEPGSDSATMHHLAELNPRLGEAELELLAVALDEELPVLITYRSNSGSVTRRVVTPLGLHHRWIEAWCHLRDDERAFTVASILEVVPA